MPKDPQKILKRPNLVRIQPFTGSEAQITTKKKKLDKHAQISLAPLHELLPPVAVDWSQMGSMRLKYGVNAV